MSGSMGADLEDALVRELAHEASRAAAHQVPQVHLMHDTELKNRQASALCICIFGQLFASSVMAIKEVA